MNWKNLFFVSTFFWIGVLIFANCSQQSPNEKKVEANFDLGNFIDCSGPNPSERCKEIKNQINAYQDFTKNAELTAKRRSTTSQDTPTYEIVNGHVVTWDTIASEMSLLRGYDFNIEDLKEILAFAESVKAKSIFTMFAFDTFPKSVHRRDSLGTPIRYLDLYFQVEKRDGSLVLFNRAGSLDGDDDDGYADFPKPCPDSCPPEG